MVHGSGGDWGAFPLVWGSSLWESPAPGAPRKNLAFVFSEIRYFPPPRVTVTNTVPQPSPRSVVIIGAGPAGLTAGYDALASGWKVTLLEKDPTYVGGISRTVCHEGYRFDIGGHRFFSKSAEVTEWWKRRLPNDFIQVRRMSRIYYRRKFFDYPLKPWNALSNLGLGTSILCVLSYGWAQLFQEEAGAFL